jgi:hypothetical protein
VTTTAKKTTKVRELKSMTGAIAYPRGMLMASTFSQIILRVDSDLTAEDKINKVIDAVWLEE